MTFDTIFQRNGNRLQLLFRAFRSRNYRLFVAGQSVSLVGTWMQQVAMSWLVYRLSGSALLLGIVGFTSQAPTFLLSPVAGVLADRLNRRNLLIATQALAMFQAALLAFFVLTELIQVWQIILLSMVLGVVNAFDIPIRQAFVVELVDDREDLGNAIALNSSMVQAARLVGPSIAGLLVAAAGEGVCFIINSASYLAVILALAAMRVSRTLPPPHQHRITHELREGFRYVTRSEPIRSILLLVALFSLTGMPYAVLLPIFANKVLHGGVHTFGFLMTAAGGGALMGTILLATRRTVLGLGSLIARATLLFAGSIALFSQSTNFYISMAALAVSGFGMMTLVASSNTILQTIVDEDKRGRVMSFFAMAFMGMAPFGSLGAGVVAKMVGVQTTVLLGAGCCLLGAWYFVRKLPSLREQIRPIYQRIGVIPDELATTAPKGG